MLFVSAASFFSDLYTGLAAQSRAQFGVSNVALASSALASRLVPWKASVWEEYAHNSVQSNDVDTALAALTEAIYWTPADAEVWAATMQVMLYGGRFDDQLKRVAKNVSKLAPNAPNLRRLIAFDGLYWWREGDAELRKIWLSSMRDSLAYQRDEFLMAIVSSRKEDNLCQYASSSLGLDKWCQWAQHMRAACASDQLTLDQRSGCQHIGFTAADKP